MHTETDPTDEIADEIDTDRWARVELMGHRTLYGRLTEITQFGVAMGQIEVPTKDGFEIVQFGGSSIYCITALSKAAVYEARSWEINPRPITRALPRPDVDPEDDWDWVHDKNVSED